MSQEVSEMNWEELLQKYSTYKGTKVDFCKENNIKKHQLDYQREKFKKESKSLFQAIELSSTDSNKAINANTNTSRYKDIRIEIGVANIYIPANEIALISTIIKELSKSC